jgi:hypothetical protein
LNQFSLQLTFTIANRKMAARWDPKDMGEGTAALQRARKRIEVVRELRRRSTLSPILPQSPALRGFPSPRPRNFVPPTLEITESAVTTVDFDAPDEEVQSATSPLDKGIFRIPKDRTHESNLEGVSLKVNFLSV